MKLSTTSALATIAGSILIAPSIVKADNYECEMHLKNTMKYSKQFSSQVKYGTSHTVSKALLKSSLVNVVALCDGKKYDGHVAVAEKTLESFK